MDDVDILVPLYKASDVIEELLKNIIKQKDVNIKKIVFPLTKSTDNDHEKVIKKIDEFNDDRIIYFLVEKKDFSHSLTREKAIVEYCESEKIIMMSEDVILKKDDVFINLANCINESVIYAFARQIPKGDGIEKYTREINYKKESYIVSKEDIERMQIRAFFSSDACAIYSRSKFVLLGGYDNKDMKFNEDMYYCKKILDNNYKFKYCAEAMCIHSHNLPLKKVYKRYYDMGIFFVENPEFNHYKKVDSGLKMALYIFFKSIIKFDIKVVVIVIPNMCARFFGMRNGKRSVKR